MARTGKAVVFRELNKPVGVEEITFDPDSRRPPGLNNPSATLTR